MVTPVVKTCGGCRWCCWSYGVTELSKDPLKHCVRECHNGCNAYDQRPPSCRGIVCPYLLGEPIHRPDTFQALLEEIGCLPAFIPAVPETMSSEKAEILILTTRTIPAMIDGRQTNDPILSSVWCKVVIPLDAKPDGRWQADLSLREPWKEYLQVAHEAA